MIFKVGTPSPKQREFFMSSATFTAYGGARGGGKSWSVQRKSSLLALNYPGINVLIIRRTFPELRENHILPMRKLLNGVATYKESDKSFYFPNGSRIKFGYCDSEGDVDQYQGQEYDVIFMDEATHFTEFQYSTLTAVVRGANDFPKRMYLTCNPGGIGHAWVKRLFVDREYNADESPEDYKFIPATVYDNAVLLEKDPNYVRKLENLPDKMREAWLHGRWDSFEGQYFTEWREHIHVIDDQRMPDEWRRYVAFDYGLDMLAAYVIAVDPHGQAIVEREHCEPGLIVSEAVQRIKELCGELSIYEYIAPPDMWNRRQETGRSVADIFAESGIYLRQASNDRVNGWLDMHEWLKPYKDEQGIEVAGLRVMRRCQTLIRCIPLLQYDQKKHSDVATEPHDITHAPDAIRYFCAGRPYAAPAVQEQKESKLPFALRDDKPQYNGGVMDW